MEFPGLFVLSNQIGTKEPPKEARDKRWTNCAACMFIFHHNLPLVLILKLSSRRNQVIHDASKVEIYGLFLKNVVPFGKELPTTFIEIHYTKVENCCCSSSIYLVLGSSRF
jgi:hypothetical protein